MHIDLPLCECLEAVPECDWVIAIELAHWLVLTHSAGQLHCFLGEVVVDHCEVVVWVECDVHLSHKLAAPAVQLVAASTATQALEKYKWLRRLFKLIHTFIHKFKHFKIQYKIWYML